MGNFLFNAVITYVCVTVGWWLGLHFSRLLMGREELPKLRIPHPRRRRPDYVRIQQLEQELFGIEPPKKPARSPYDARPTMAEAAKSLQDAVALLGGGARVGDLRRSAKDEEERIRQEVLLLARDWKLGHTHVATTPRPEGSYAVVDNAGTPLLYGTEQEMRAFQTIVSNQGWGYYRVRFVIRPDPIADWEAAHPSTVYLTVGSVRTKAPKHQHCWHHHATGTYCCRCPERRYP